MMMLAVTAEQPNLFETVNGVFCRFDALAHPSALVSTLSQMSIVWAVVFLIAGLVCLLNGYRLYKWVTIILALAIGAFAGYTLGKSVNGEYIVAACLGALLAVCCWPLMKYAVALMGGLVGAFLGANAWGAMAGLVADHSTRDHVAGTYWVGALMGLIICGMLSFILFKVTILVFTSISGATIAMIGALGLILQVPPWRASISSWSLSANQVILPLLVVVPATMGLILQHTRGGEPAGGAGKSASGSGGSGKSAAKAAAA
jgi:hypothetical protein